MNDRPPTRSPLNRLILVALATLACQGASLSATSGSVTDQLDARNARDFSPAITTAGQPSEADIAKVVEAGYSGIVNLRGEGESGNWNASAVAAEGGVAYHALPIAGAGDISWDNARRLRTLLEEIDPSAEHPVLVHCASSNRVGALFALKHYLDESERTDAETDAETLVEASLAEGSRAGLSSLEPVVRKLLESGPTAP